MLHQDGSRHEDALGERIPPSTDFCCDGGAAVTAFAKRAKLKIHVLPAPGNQPEDPRFHINNVNPHHAASKNGCDASTAWLPAYLGCDEL